MVSPLGLRKGDEHSAYTPRNVVAHFTVTLGLEVCGLGLGLTKLGLAYSTA